MATKGRIKKSIKKFTSGVKSGFNKAPAYTQTANASKSKYGIGGSAYTKSNTILGKQKAFFPTPTGKAIVPQSKYSIGGYSSTPKTSILNNKGNTYSLKPTAGATGAQTPVPKTTNPVGGQTKVPMNFTPVPTGAVGGQTFVPSSGGGSSSGGSQGSSFGNVTPVNGGIEDTVDTVKGETTASGPATVSGGGSTTSALRVGTTAAPAGATAGGTTASASGGGLTIAPAGSEGYLSGYDYSLSNEERAMQEARDDELKEYGKQKNERVDREEIMRDALRLFQGEIDAQNSVYADKLQQAKLSGMGRLQRVRAENFNAGAVNSSFEEAAIERANKYNLSEQDVINNEKLALIAQIESAAREAGDKYYTEKKAAKAAGFDAYMTSLGNAKTAKQAISVDIANNMLMSNVGIEQLNPDKLASIAKSAGVTVQSIKSAYEEARQLAEAEQAAAEQEAAKAERESQFNLSEGEARYDSQGNLIASRAKTYAPSSGGSSSSGLSSSGISAAAQSYLDRYNSGSASYEEIMKAIPGVTGQALRDEISIAIAAQSGTLPDFARNKIIEAQGLVNELLLDSKGKRSAVGSSFGKLIGDGSRGLQGKRVGFETKAKQLAGILTLDNLGVLKGPLSDADREFIQVVSSGQNLNMSEADFDANLRRILAKLDVKLGVSSGGADVAPEDDALLAEFGL